MERAAVDFAPLASAGLRAYGRSAQLALTPAQASVSLHERLCQELVAARLAYQAGRLDRMCRHTQRCMRIFLVLRNDLDRRERDEGRDEGARVLSSFYLHLFQRLLGLLRTQSPGDELDALIALLRDFCTKLRVIGAGERRTAN